MNPLHPKKLRLTQWTTAKPQAQDKHFLVTRVITPESPQVAIE